MADKREAIALKYGLCKCDEIYTSRGLTAPDCPYHSMCVTEAMDEYMEQCCLELLSYVVRNTTGHSIDKDGTVHFKYKGEWLSKEELFENFL